MFYTFSAAKLTLFFDITKFFGKKKRIRDDFLIEGLHMSKKSITFAGGIETGGI